MRREGRPARCLVELKDAGLSFSFLFSIFSTLFNFATTRYAARYDSPCDADVGRCNGDFHYRTSLFSEYLAENNIAFFCPCARVLPCVQTLRTKGALIILYEYFWRVLYV